MTLRINIKLSQRAHWKLWQANLRKEAETSQGFYKTQFMNKGRVFKCDVV